jgi:ParB/RepB/Spo0J family partition protein
MPELKTVKISQIRVPDVRVSSVLDEEQRAMLAATVQAVGVVQDPVVRALPDGSYELVAGRSRIQQLASQGFTEVPVKVIEADEKTGLIMNIIENVARGGYDYISISQAIRKLRGMGATAEELEKIFPWSRRWIEFIEGLQDLPEDVVEAVRSRKITPTHVQVALDLPTPYEVHDGLRTAINLGWDTGTFKTYVKNRVEQIERARQGASAKGVAPVIPPAVPQELIQYVQCLLCGYKKPREQVTVQHVCDTCRDIAGYVTANLGSDENAIQTLYYALQAHFGVPQGKPSVTGGAREAPSQG